MGRLALRQVLRVPKYIGEMLIVRSQDQLKPPDPRSQAKFGSPFELNLSGWSKSEPKPSIRELIEGPLPYSAADRTTTRFGKVGTSQRIDLRRARRRAKYFTHITTMTGGLFSNWKQVSKTLGVYRDFLENRMDYELDSQLKCPIDESFVANNPVQQIALEKFRSKGGVEWTPEDLNVKGKAGVPRLRKVNKRFHCLIDETKVISKKRFTELDRILKLFPIV